ncbi:competence protein ComEC [Sulfuricaulis limicola]|uniref:Competence protein ComEC n=1 Tax=Sulfuricaulis limicola TaxID=1620215 RepID=A0A1B4XFS6_9GAMM|nr:DNA internalization-related competence protein ComEC/Rec2 [Sulfuricaulis limicola]BAV33660.1 competence protein ComEC [Sulfuricaulis limicola]
MAFLGGVLLVQQLAALPSLWWALLLPPLLWLARRRPLWFVPVFFVAGVVWTSLRAGLILQDSLPPELEGRDLLVEGRIDDIPKPTDFGLRFELEVTHASLDGAPARVPRRILLNSRDRDFQPRAGETWRLLVRLKRPHGYQNPGGFDYEAHLFRDRIRARGYVRDATAPQRLGPEPAWHDIDRWRQDLGDRIRARLPDNEYAGIIVALANGDGRGLAEEQWQILRRTGTLHLVAISGLHISLIAGVVFFIARWLWALPGTTVLRLPAPQFGAVCALLAAAFYAALAGFVVPTQRALIMLAVAMAGILLRRRFPPSQLLAVAGLAVLVYDPLSVMAAGFWLSFAAVAVILFFMHGDRVQMPVAWKWGYIQWAIALGMLPLMLAMFGQLSLVAPLANMLAVPVFDLLLVPLTLCGALLLGVAPDAAGWLFGFAAWLLHGLWQALTWLAEPSFSQWTQPAPPAWALACGVAGVLLLLAPRGWPARWTGIVWLLPMFLVRPPLPGTGEVWFTLLDVGQGLSAVVRTREHALLFDAGPRFGDFDTGQAVVEPYLRAAGVRRLDAFIVSHGDMDHVGGAESVLHALPVRMLLSSVPEKLPPAQPCRAGQTWNWDGVEFDILGPDDDAGASRRNDASCVLQVRSRHGNILLPADIEAKAEKKLVQQLGGRLRSEILVAPHHGSKTSSTPAFIEAVAPRHVLFPVGYRNRYRHAHPDVVQRYVERGAALYDSPSAGALEFRLDAAGLNATAYRVRQRRYWYAD